MKEGTLTEALVREVPLLRADQRVGDAARAVGAARLPALPVVDESDALFGIFGEREFITALFPGYLGELRTAAFVPASIDEAIEKRVDCSRKPVSDYTNTEHIDAGPDHSGTQLAETFLHHRVLIIPIVDDRRRVLGVVTRWDFFNALVERFTERTQG